MLNILGIDTCCMPATSAIYDGEKIVGEAIINCGKTHSQKIMPQISQLMKQSDIGIGDIDVFAVAGGPGSFTGVRIGVSTIKAMAHGASKPCVMISTLEALANNVPYFSGIICPILDARRNQVYTASFSGDGSLKRITEDRAMMLDALLYELEEKEEKVLFLGDGVLVHMDTIKDRLKDKAIFTKGHLCLNMAGSVAELAYRKYISGDTTTFSELVPNYIRKSQAERERLERISKK